MTRERTGSSIWAAGYPLPGADQRMPGTLAHIRQMHGVDPVGDPARAAQVLPLHAGCGLALLLLAGLVQRPDHQAAPPPGTAGCLIQAGHREPAHHAIAAKVSHEARLSSRCVLSGARSPRMLGDRPAVTLRQPADQRIDILAGLQPRLRPCETRSQQAQQLPALPGA